MKQQNRKMQDLQTNKAVVTCVDYYGHPARQLCWPPAILFYRCSLDLFHCPISEVAWLIVTKLCHMFDGDRDL